MVLLRSKEVTMHITMEVMHSDIMKLSADFNGRIDALKNSISKKITDNV